MPLLAPDQKAVMTLTAILILGLAMSTDAFAVAIAMGARRTHIPLSEALRTGLLFGVIEGFTPVIGWMLGSMAASYVAAWDHWIAFVLLGGLGLRMIHAGMGEPEETEELARRPFWLLVLTGFATSIDALVVGFGLAFADTSIVTPAVAIGVATLSMVTLGLLIGHRIGAIVGKRAEVFGGVVLIAVGALTLWDHLR